MPDRRQALDLLMLWREAHRQYEAHAAGIEERIVWREEMDRLRLEYLDAVDAAPKASMPQPPSIPEAPRSNEAGTVGERLLGRSQA
jgi:hypothetical protein